ncbi:MAG: tol-pal system protein YbgF [Panacagrimonas sp.]
MTVRRISKFMIVGASALWLAGCADFGGPISGSSATVLSPEERRLQDVETKTAQLSRRLDALNSSQSDQDLSRLREETRLLRGDIEKLRFDLDAREKSAKDLYLDLDRRMQRVESGATAATAAAGLAGSATVPTTSPGTLAPAATPKAAVATPEEERAYLGTFDLLKNGKYDEAVKGFRAMLDQWPQGRYADNGWYWMGEAQLVKRDYPGAVASFQSLVQRFPSSPKMADGLYKLSLAQIETNRPAEARASLQRVLREFPSTNAANLAKQKLDQLGG